MEAKIRKLEAEKLTSFWNKFWLIMSCGCYNNHGKKTRKIEEKKRKLKDVKKEIEKLLKNNVANNENEPQSSTSSATTNDEEAWSNKIKVEIEKSPLPKENSKNLSSTLN